MKPCVADSSLQPISLASSIDSTFVAAAATGAPLPDGCIEFRKVHCCLNLISRLTGQRNATKKAQQCDKLYELILRLADVTEELARSARADESLISRIGSIHHEALLITNRVGD